MKRLIKNEEGYALVVVLLVVIILSIVATTFFSTSLSHRKQEATVEAGTLSVGAAEMGVRSTHYDLRKGIEGLWQPIAADVDRQLNELEADLVVLVTQGKSAPAGTCQNANLQAWADCEASKINERAKTEFRQAVIDHLTEYENNHKETTVTLDEKVGYLLKEIDKTETGAGMVKASYVIEGTEGSREREVTGNLTIEIPEFLSKKEEDRKLVTARPVDPEAANRQVMTPPATDISCKHTFYRIPEPCVWPDNDSGLLNWLEQNSDRASELAIIVKDICSATGNNCNINQSDFHNATLFVKPESKSDEMKNGNINKFHRSFLYYDGLFDIQNWRNVYENKFIVRGLDTHNALELEDNTVAILGGEGMSIAWKKIYVSSGSKVCINLAGIEKPSSNLFSSGSFDVRNGGKVVFYPSKLYSFLPREEGSSVIYTDNYVDFLNHCDISVAADSSDYTIYGNQRNSATIETEVDYLP